MSQPAVRIVPEADGWSIFIPGMPVAAAGRTRAEAVSEMISVLRQYADDWHDHLRDATNHERHREFVRWITNSTDDELRDQIDVPTASKIDLI